MKMIMHWRLKVAFSCYLLGLLILVLLGFMYLFRSEFMPYHATAVGQSWDEVDPAFQILIIALMKVTGGGWLASAFAIAILLFIPFRKGMRWAYWAIPIIGLSTTLTSLYATIYVATNTPASPPWMAAAMGVLLIVAGFIFSVIRIPKIAEMKNGSGK